jgi:hypothetical protein
VYLCDINNCAQWSLNIPKNKKVSDYVASTNDVVTSLGNQNIGYIWEFSTSVPPDPPNPGDNGEINQFLLQISGKELHDSIFNLDKSVYIPEVVNLRITWLPGVNMGFEADDVDTAPNVFTALTENVKIEKLSYYLAVEQNKDVVNNLKSQVLQDGGMQVMFASSFMYRNHLAIGNQHSLIVRVGRGQGVRLDKITTLPINDVEEVNTRYNSTVTNIDNLYSLLDSRRLQEFNVNTTNKDDVFIQNSMTKDTVYGMFNNRDEFFSWTDNWCDNMKDCANDQKQIGLDLSLEKKYDIYFTLSGTGVAANYYTKVVTQRIMNIMPTGLEVL